MGKPHIIYEGGEPVYALLSWKHYEFYQKRIGEVDLSDEELFDLSQLEDEEAIPMYVSERLSAGEKAMKVYREYRGMTQKQLAEKVGISPEYVSQIEGGKKQGTVDTLKSIAEALSLDLDDLV